MDSEFKAIVAPSYYFPSELQQRKVAYNCSNQNELTMTDFDGQGHDYRADMGTDHLVIGPLRTLGEWTVVCIDPLNLLPYNHPHPSAEDTFSAHVTRRALPMLKHIPTSDEAQLILGRWMQHRRFTCRSNEQNLNIACAALLGMLAHNLCADDLFVPVQTIVNALDNQEKVQLKNHGTH